MRRALLGGLSGLVLLIAVLLLVYSVWLILVEPMVRARDVSRAATLPLVTAQSLPSMVPGRRVLVSGVVCPQNPGQVFELKKEEGPRRFVSYKYEELVSDTETKDGGRVRSWGWLWRVSQPMRLDLPDGTVQIPNINYDFWSSHSGFTKQGTFVTGFAVGDTALVEGTVLPSSSGPALHAEFIHVRPS